MRRVWSDLENSWLRSATHPIRTALPSMLLPWISLFLLNNTPLRNTVFRNTPLRKSFLKIHLYPADGYFRFEGRKELGCRFAFFSNTLLLSHLRWTQKNHWSGFLDIFVRIPTVQLACLTGSKLNRRSFRFSQKIISTFRLTRAPLLSVGPNIADGSNVDGPNYPGQMLIRPPITLVNRRCLCQLMPQSAMPRA